MEMGELRALLSRFVQVISGDSKTPNFLLSRANGEYNTTIWLSFFYIAAFTGFAASS